MWTKYEGRMEHKRLHTLFSNNFLNSNISVFTRKLNTTFQCYTNVTVSVPKLKARTNNFHQDLKRSKILFCKKRYECKIYYWFLVHVLTCMNYIIWIYYCNKGFCHCQDAHCKRKYSSENHYLNCTKSWYFQKMTI